MNPLINRVSQYIDVDSEAFQSIVRLPHRIETKEAGQDIVVEGEKVDYIFLIESGWAIRYRMLDDGRRQIINFMLAGDCFDLMSINRAKSDHSVSAATKVTLRRIKASDFLRVIAGESQLATAFWWVAIQEEAILREQIIRIGRRTARERIAHLILELNRRTSMAFGADGDILHFPISQTHIADALGLSVVHVSRTLTRLKSEGLIKTTHNSVEILERDKMAEMSDFDSRYIHMEKLTLR
jgi:CRP-like cAMP-binding protein